MSDDDKTDVQNIDKNSRMETLLFISTAKTGSGMVPGMPDPSGVILPCMVFNSDKDEEK